MSAPIHDTTAPSRDGTQEPMNHGADEQETCGQPFPQRALPSALECSRLATLKDYVSQFGASPFFRSREGMNCGRIAAAGSSLDNFSSYDYLGLASNPSVLNAARDAIARYGTSVSASRVISGEIALHRTLERTLAGFIGAEDCISYVSGYATNVTAIGHLFGRQDIILFDEQIHNSALVGCKLSGARRIAFRHNDMQHLNELLRSQRGQHHRTLILVEGVYSMEGDIAPLPELLELKERNEAFLMVDEAHSIGVLGASGRGVREHFGIDPNRVDLWMGTMSKALASCGGYIAGRAGLIDYLRHTSPGFVYSVGMPPSSAAAAIAALHCIEAQPQRVALLRERARYFAQCAASAGLDIGRSAGTPVIPVMLGQADVALGVAQRLHQAGIQVAPIFYPAVGRNGARLRFFVTTEHTEAQIRLAVQRTAEAIELVKTETLCDALD
jgi:8-amino-7-oxononanoate synthase